MKRIIYLLLLLFMTGCSPKEEQFTDQSTQDLTTSSPSSSESSTIESEAKEPELSETELLGKVFSGEAIFNDGKTVEYTISFNAVKRDDLVGDVLFTSFPGSQVGAMEYFDRMTVKVTGANTFQVTAEQPTLESVEGKPWLTLDITKTGNNQIEFSQEDKRYILSYDEKATNFVKENQDNENKDNLVQGKEVVNYDEAVKAIVASLSAGSDQNFDNYEFSDEGVHEDQSGRSYYQVRVRQKAGGALERSAAIGVIHLYSDNSELVWE